jgi:uncharacterized protein (TIGR02145 family)
MNFQSNTPIFRRFFRKALPVMAAFILTFACVAANAQKVSNIKANFACPGQVTVTYDLNTPATVNVTLYYSSNKRNWLTAQTVTGDLAAQNTGTGKTIIWNSFADNVRFGKFFFKVEAPQIPEPECVWINGVCWATRNVDAPGTFAANPEDAGMFYQWNRKTGWASTGSVTGWDSSYSTGTEWEKANDPSPAGFRVPTYAEIQTLLDAAKVGNVWTTVNGVNGITFTDKTSGNSIFLPAAGYRGSNGGTLYRTGSGGYYWSSTQYDSSNAYFLYFYSGNADWSIDYRNCGFSVRSVAEF